MKKINLNTIIKKCKIDKKIINNKNFQVKGISLHSKETKNNYIFAAAKGGTFNGEDFINDLLRLNNIAIIISSNSKVNFKSSKFDKITFILVQDVKKTISEIASILYPNKIEKKFAVTGTNGKTSVSSFVYQIWRKQNCQAAFVGTLGVISNNNRFSKTNLTTADAITNHKILYKLNNSKCKNIIFEASSIGLHQERLYPIKFDVVAFTNLSKDHLDYHKNIKNYKTAKSLLFSNYTKKKSVAVINSDSKFSNFFFKNCKDNQINILDYGKKADFLRILQIKKIKNRFIVKIDLNKKQFEVEFKCSSQFEIYNQLCALLMVFGKKIDQRHMHFLRGLKNPDGRLEKIYDKNDIRVYVDYAHTADALSKVLYALKQITLGKLFLVFGCGGDRDRDKRSLMTKEALKHSDQIFITDDNPRFEDPEQIISDMIKGLDKKNLEKVKIIRGRSKAIKFAINQLSKNDILLIAGKGHEDYQIIKNKRYNFSDKRIAKGFLRVS